MMIYQFTGEARKLDLVNIGEQLDKYADFLKTLRDIATRQFIYILGRFEYVYRNIIFTAYISHKIDFLRACWSVSRIPKVIQTPT
jgi:hypothetical protein